MSDLAKQFRDMVADTLRTIREETTRKVREREFRDRMSAEEHRRAEEALATFHETMDRVIGIVDPEEPGVTYGIGSFDDMEAAAQDAAARNRVSYEAWLREHAKKEPTDG